MQKLRAIFIGVLLIFSLNVLAAEKAKDSPCDNNAYCVDGSHFSVEVTKIRKRGNVIIIQLQYTGGPQAPRSVYSTPFQISFGSDKTTGGKEGHATILDANGNEFVIAGSEMSHFGLRRGNIGVMSLKFKSDKQIVEPFDLTMKSFGKHGEITLFDLNSADFSNKKSNDPDVKETKTEIGQN